MIRLGPLAAALLRAAADGRLHRASGVYRWRPRNAVTRSMTSPTMTVRCVEMVAHGLILPPDNGDTTVAITERGRDALVAHYEGAPVFSTKTSNDSSTNPGTPLGKALTEARKKADQAGQTGRSR